ncbi:hypothetical protein PsYK624_073370 [Phanerochaete sordida]|uniref:Transcription factor BYE1 n=1 Tax=Phanerochaete sordida TaxID=48140 RepID=A0A9P3G8A0_9APHY|nr:hypothetical protein PsYK624_073370 [Phanerochaete sordida]
MSTRILRRQTQASSSQHNSSEKENATKQNGSSAELRSKSKPAGKAHKLYCSCRQPDDGSPMILCSECKEMYHFKCVDLDERDAEDIQLFVCPSCHEKTGLQTVMDWEGPEALEDRNATPAPTAVRVKKQPSPAPTPKKESEPEESTNDESGDDFVAESVKARPKRRRAQPPTSDEESESDNDSKRRTTVKHIRRPSTASTGTRVRTVSASPGPSGPLKRRQSTASHQPEPKRKRSESDASNAGADAARKYCLTKLQELFRDIFLRYPVLDDTAENDQLPTEKKPEELTAEEKEQIENRANRFTTELEECMFEIYAEPDAKTGKHSVAAKYKERFRMLTFNLSKPDRVVLHKRIAASHISPKELSTMSSTDLADEETKQSIRQAEQEALEHSILKKTVMPRAKMTHKGIQDIEDVSGGAQRDREREREQEEEERIERERQERLKLQAQRQAAARASLPPDSPVTPITPSWGAPPPVPMHALHTSTSDPGALGRPPVNPLFVHTASEFAPPTPVEHELNLADLINIDEEPGQEVSISLAAPALPPIADSAPAPHDARSPDEPSLPTPLTGISPFASRSSHPELASRPSFDLNAIWSPKDENAPPVPEPQDVAMQEERPQEPMTASPLGVEIIGEEANDQDFDMFLNGGDEDAEPTRAATPVPPQTPEDIQAAYDAQSPVWSGKVSMPLDSTIPQEVDVKARQAGGTKLEADSPLWKTLFPVDHLRIDGRVPVNKSAQYLTQSRLNVSRELIAVAFSPESEASAASFDLLSKYLLDKGRHGLIFPWGHRPKDHHPGRELYIVPLPASEPLPEFVELLDDLQIPRIRKHSYMIGIYVLTKGKLAPPPNMPPPNVPATNSPIPPTPTPTLTGLAPAGSGQHPIQPPQVPPIPLQPQLSSSTPPIPSAPAPISSGLPEIAALTPEQIQLMLRTLSANGQMPIPPLSAPQLPPAAPQMPPGTLPPTTMPGAIPPAAAPPPQWAGFPGPPFSSFPPAAGPQHAMPHAPYAPPPFEHGPPPYGYGAPPPAGHQYDSFDRGGDRGHRGRGGGRGRARGNQHNQHQQGDRPRDSGWGGRGRGRGRGGQPGGSPERQWGSPQRWNQ